MFHTIWKRSVQQARSHKFLLVYSLPLSWPSIRYSNHSPATFKLFLMSSALYKMEKSPFNVGLFGFLCLMLSAFHVFVWLVTKSVQPPPSRVISQYVFTGPFPSGLIVYTPSGNWTPVCFPRDRRWWQECATVEMKEYSQGYRTCPLFRLSLNMVTDITFCHSAQKLVSFEWSCPLMIDS